ncbi:hypothetical protein IJJ53_01190 [Candidatus Saccharibacteria bacterium]|nr:hypothetical protein [Candidatus Saccharibacteria bacterium]
MIKRHSKLFAIFLYALPILFFTIGYFLLTTSGEDVFQGASTFRFSTPTPLSDMAGAFEHSGRITDMYAWSVIDFFDYQFRFGPDLIFRLLDVAMISACFYLATFLVLDRKPTLKLKDSLIFCGLFVGIVFSPFGRRLYSEFSMIHNYVPLVLLTLLFAFPYLKLLRGATIPRTTALAFLMIPLGFVFGMSTTITPLAVFITVIVYCIVYRKSLTRPPAWFFTGLIALLAGWAISFFLSSGMSDYTNNSVAAASFDYVAISSIFTDFTTAIPKLLFHLIYNFGLTLIPLTAIVIVCLIFSNRPAFFSSLRDKTTRKYIFVFAFFTILHILAAIQIKSPPRILIPAHFAGVILILKLFTPLIKSKLLASTVVIFTTVAVILHTVFLSIYHTQAASILQEIETSPESTICIDYSRNIAPHIPIISLSQEYLLVDWGTPVVIYGKDVTFCK